MNKKSFLLIISLFVCSMITLAQTGKSDLEQRADAEIASKHNINARALYVRAFEDYVAKGQTEQGVACGVKATTLYYSENSYQEAFELLRNIDQAIQSSRGLGTDKKAALRYQTSRERMNMYMRMHRSASVAEQLSNMENHAATANNDEVSNDLLYNKAIYYYSQGQTTKGNETFELLSSRMMNGGDDQKMDEAFRNVIATGRKAGNAYMVDQAYRRQGFNSRARRQTVITSDLHHHPHRDIGHPRCSPRSGSHHPAALHHADTQAEEHHPTGQREQRPESQVHQQHLRSAESYTPET